MEDDKFVFNPVTYIILGGKKLLSVKVSVSSNCFVMGIFIFPAKVFYNKVSVMTCQHVPEWHIAYITAQKSQ